MVVRCRSIAAGEASQRAIEFRKYRSRGGMKARKRSTERGERERKQEARRGRMPMGGLQRGGASDSGRRDKRRASAVDGEEVLDKRESCS